jgi:predicted ATP-dependent endonuclease of OLD family
VRISKVEVKGLFGIFDHQIPMDKDEGVTIIHGPNGFGKTVMLKMIAGALKGESSIFHTIPFREFRMDLSDGTAWVLRAEKNEPDSKVAAAKSLKLSIVSESGDEIPLQLSDVQSTPAIARILDRIDRKVPSPFARTANGWRDREGQFYSLPEILRLFPAARNAVAPGELTAALGNTWSPIGIDVFVVEANRLPSTEDFVRNDRNRLAHGYYEEPETYSPPPSRIEQYSFDLVQRIKNVRSDYAKVTQERDSTFPERLVQFLRKNETALEEGDVVAKLEELDRTRRRLIALGFLDSERVLGSFKEEDARLAREALTIYVDDVQAKLSAFDEMADRAGKLMQIIKRRFQYKELKISREQGFIVASQAGGKVRLLDLSSGEQHELILLYELLFRTPTNGLILVDEPEISLHVGWQTHFLSDLIDILKLNGAYALVATHSPVLVGNQWGLTKELTGPNWSETEGTINA